MPYRATRKNLLHTIFFNVFLCTALVAAIMPTAVASSHVSFEVDSQVVDKTTSKKNFVPSIDAKDLVLEMSVRLIGTNSLDDYRLVVIGERVDEEGKQFAQASMNGIFVQGQIIVEHFYSGYHESNGKMVDEYLFAARLYLVPADGYVVDGADSFLCGKDVLEWGRTRPSCALDEYLIDVAGIFDRRYPKTIENYFTGTELSQIRLEDRDEIKLVPPSSDYTEEVITDFEEYQNPFSDVETDSLEGKSALELYRREVINGYEDGEFKMDRFVNRAELSKLLLLTREIETVASDPNSRKFSDVARGEWYEEFVVTAENEGIISGHPDGTFRPADTVNTAEFLKMLTLTFDLPTHVPHSYSDVSSDDWFAQFAGAADTYDLFPDRSQTLLEPSSLLSREEVITAIYQFLRSR